MFIQTSTAAHPYLRCLHLGPLQNPKLFKGRGHLLSSWYYRLSRMPTTQYLSVGGRNNQKKGRRSGGQQGDVPGFDKGSLSFFSQGVPSLTLIFQEKSCTTCPSTICSRTASVSLCAPRYSLHSPSSVAMLLRVSRKERKGKSPHGLQFLNLITHQEKTMPLSRHSQRLYRSQCYRIFSNLFPPTCPQKGTFDTGANH